MSEWRRIKGGWKNDKGVVTEHKPGTTACYRNDDGSVSHYDEHGNLTRITHVVTPTGRPKDDIIGYGPNVGKTYFGPKGGCKKS